MAISETFPAYPPAAKEARITGDVIARVQIGKNGSVERVQSSAGPPALVGPALAALIKWKFEPYKDSSGESVGIDTIVTIHFQPEDNL